MYAWKDNDVRENKQTFTDENEKEGAIRGERFTEMVSWTKKKHMHKVKRLFKDKRRAKGYYAI